ncbi:hypothetical protein [Chryseobacterium sp.]|uniref:hypothetical protein n=1 Tax=Chryseobacterium sp. TaxID=1871047 RepID=UPI001B171DF7|nr:hypothetical protein [Chryseobacterium sp.]MBO9691672.1 hypothetical protein [Chryseobacterium sp.]
MHKSISTKFFLLFITAYSSFLLSQVGINTQSPNKMSTLDIVSKSNDTGILIPRLTENQRNKMSPGIKENSLLIFNTDESCYNYWNSTENEWKSLCGKQGKAVFTMDCAQIESKGKYTTGKELTASNVLHMKITVTKPGYYHLTAKTANSNGYSFQVEGEVLEAGTFTIDVPGSGTPINATPSGGTGDQILIYNDEQLLCDALKISVEDSTIIPEFTINCSSKIINGQYIADKELTAGNTIALNITSPATAAGAFYEISTPVVNGYSFSAKGVLFGGVQQITLIGTGKPVKNGIDEFILTSNSALAKAPCSINIKVAARKMKIIGLSNNDNSYNIARTDNLLNKALKNDYYFADNQSAICPVNGFEFLQLSNLGSAQQSQFKTFNPDIVFIQFNYIANSLSEQQFLADYVASGGVLIYCSDGDSAGSSRNVAARNLARLIFNNNSMNVTDNDATDTMIIQDTGNKISNGPFLLLSGKSIARDAGWNFRFTIDGFPLDKANIIAYGDGSNSSIRAFAGKNNGFVFFGDGAPFAANESNQPYNWPAKFKTTNGITAAIPNTYGAVPTYNSYLFLNIIAWAIDFAQKRKE